MNLEKLKAEVDKFASDRDWDQFHSVKNLSIALSVESSELLEIFQWMSEEESNQIKNNPAKLVKVEDEAADIFVYLLHLTGKLNIDLEKAVINKMKKNIEKYPVELSRGNSKKYDEL
ncbi:MAG: nucleotide pyrophosphohydrolase [Bacteriovorax sp.]|nr:nucleotide pyrophosphohydrolase [Bacteriovorax sp.]